jgi:hypothetical protein
MNNDVDISVIQKLAKFFARQSSKLDLPKPSRLVFTGDVADLADLKSLGVLYIDDPDGIVINLKSISKEHKVIFRKWLGQEFTEETYENDTVFFDVNGDYAVLTSSKLVSWSSDDFKNTIENVIAYYRLKITLSEESVSDHHNSGGKQFVFYSSTKGVIKITYESPAPLVVSQVNLVIIQSLIESIKNPAHKIHFINGLFKITNEKPIVSLATIITNADLIVAIIKRDYEITLKQFDFDKFKDNLLKEKDKYFNSVREIVNKVFGQLIGIPISISASAFATYKVENEASTLALILLGFAFYVFLYIKIQLSYLNDLIDIKTDFDRDFEEIKLKSGLEEKLIQVECDKVHKKIRQTRSMIRIMIGGICVLGVSFVIYLVNQLIATFSGIDLFRAFLRLLFGC